MNSALAMRRMLWREYADRLILEEAEAAKASADTEDAEAPVETPADDP